MTLKLREAPSAKGMFKEHIKDDLKDAKEPDKQDPKRTPGKRKAVSTVQEGAWSLPDRQRPFWLLPCERQ